MDLFILIASGFSLICLVYFVYKVLFQYSYWKLRNVPHIGFTPLLGSNGPLIFRTASFAEHVTNLYKRYPGARYYGFFDFTRPAVLIKDPELIREVCIKDFESFMNHDAFVNEEMDPIAGRNLFSLEGQRWKDVRGTLSPTYTASRMKLIFDLIVECSDQFVQYYLEHPEAAMNIDAKEAYIRYTCDVIATAAFGIKVNSMKDQTNEFYMNGSTAIKFGPLWFFKLQLLRFFPNIMRSLGVTFLPATIDRFFKRLMNETVKLREEKNIIRPDMIQLLIQAMRNKDGVKVTMDDIMGQAIVFILAGFDSSSTLMIFTTLELAANQDIQEKLYQEIQEQLDKNNGNISYDSLSEMEYLEMVIKETLRLYPPAPVTNRVCRKDYKFSPASQGSSEFNMKKGSIVMIPILGIHRDPKYFPDPDKFLPERFSDENKREIHPYTYMPFGHGPRRCIGERFALMETKIIIISIVRNFVIKLVDETKYPVEFSKKGFSLNIEGGLQLKFEPRKKNN